jgi:hypothetical protein
MAVDGGAVFSALPVFIVKAARATGNLTDEYLVPLLGLFVASADGMLSTRLVAEAVGKPAQEMRRHECHQSP